MGRHRRSDAGRAATSRADETTTGTAAGQPEGRGGATPPSPGPRTDLPRRPRPVSAGATGPSRAAWDSYVGGPADAPHRGTAPRAGEGLPPRPHEPLAGGAYGGIGTAAPYGGSAQPRGPVDPYARAGGAAYPDGSRGAGPRPGQLPGAGVPGDAGGAFTRAREWPQSAPPAAGGTAQPHPSYRPYAATSRHAAAAPLSAPYPASAPYAAQTAAMPSPGPRIDGRQVPPPYTSRAPVTEMLGDVGPVENPDVALFPDDDEPGDEEPAEIAPPERRGAAHRHRRRAATPVRTGLLGASAAVALGAIAVTSGVLPGGDRYTVGGGPDKVRPEDSPYGFETQGGTDGPQETEGTPGTATGTSSSPSGKHTSPSHSPAPSKKPTAKKSAPARTATPKAPPSSKPPAAKPPADPPPPTLTQSQATAAQVLALVNQERGKAGCSPLVEDTRLTNLAAAFSRDMASRGFFDHTDPDGEDPWDRARAAGIDNLGGENIARGQADAEAVMDSWMNSPGHRANILNCDYKTLGVGVFMGDGGPWWTQDFGF